MNPQATPEQEQRYRAALARLQDIGKATRSRNRPKGQTLNDTEAAAFLGISRSQLYRRLATIPRRHAGTCFWFNRCDLIEHMEQESKQLGATITQIIYDLTNSSLCKL